MYFTKNGALRIAGITLVGVNRETGEKLLISIAFIVGLVLVRMLLHQLASTFGKYGERPRFWSHQVISIAFLSVLIIGLVSVWFDNPARLATVFGLVSAGLAVALQRVITSFAAYFILLRGRNFHVGDRITMGGVRGDVITLGFIQTQLMETGDPVAGQATDPPIWVRSRQYTGRIVTVSNAKIFDEPVYNYTTEFPYIWDEIQIPIRYNSDHQVAEEIVLKAAQHHTLSFQNLSEQAVQELERRHSVKREQIRPMIYYRLTDNWLELTVRFITPYHGTRELKDAISRDVLRGFKEAGIDIASSTQEIVGFPPVRVQLNGFERNDLSGRETRANNITD
jgi:small-conductance mechanosensitive channel